MRTFTFWKRAFVVATLALAATGCTATSPYMHEVLAPQAPVKAADKATVVFVRPSGFGSGIRVTLLDDKGKFLGDSLPSSHFSRQIDPGKHLFISWAENTDGLQATLEAGKTYFVEVEIKMGALSARSHLKALTSKSEKWPKRDEWLSESKELSVDDKGGQTYLDGRAEDVAERIRRAHEAMTKYDAEELSERTLVATDGM